jgi:arylsulfatase A-like enzyme
MAWALCAVAADRPNIVIILADDIGYSDFGAFGGEISTPHIDALAASGLRFSNFHAASSCAPTRAMLLTGADNHLAGIGSMRELMPLSHRGKPGYGGVLNERVRTIATHLRDAGYRTAVAGKWHLGIEPGNLPAARGFDHSVIQADSGSDNFEMRPYLPMNPEVYWFEDGERLESLPEDFYSSTFFVDKMIEFLDRGGNSGKPFFAYLAFQANHTPIQAPAQFIDPYRGRYLQGWAQVRSARIQRLRELGLIDENARLAPGPSQAEWDALDEEQQYFEARRMQAYAGMATAMDAQVGRFISYLNETGELDNTVFVVLSDNGAVGSEPYENEFGRRWLEANYHREVETLGEKGSWVSSGRRWGRVSNTPLAGYKFSASGGGVRVPLLISGLPMPEPGAVYHDFVHVTDLAPTVLDIAGVGPVGVTGNQVRMSGTSLLPVLAPDPGPVHGAGQAIGYEFSGNAALYRDGYKLVKNRPPAGDGQWRLYDLANDPGETLDLAGAQPQRFQSMQQAYARYERDHGVLPMPDDYSLTRQVAVNTLLFFYLPRYLPYIVTVLVLVATVLLHRRIRRRA